MTYDIWTRAIGISALGWGIAIGMAFALESLTPLGWALGCTVGVFALAYDFHIDGPES